MGCNTSAVVPLGDSDLEDSTGIKVRVNPSTPEGTTSEDGKPKTFVLRSSPTALESAEPPEELLTKDFNLEKRAPPRPPLAFEIPIHENGSSIIKKHPPKRLRRLEEIQAEAKDLTHEWIDGKQMEAEARRKELLQQRVLSVNHGSQRRIRKLVHSDAFSQESEEDLE